MLMKSLILLFFQTFDFFKFFQSLFFVEIWRMAGSNWFNRKSIKRANQSKKQQRMSGKKRRSAGLTNPRQQQYLEELQKDTRTGRKPLCPGEINSTASSALVLKVPSATYCTETKQWLNQFDSTGKSCRKIHGNYLTYEKNFMYWKVTAKQPICLNLNGKHSGLQQR